MHGLEIICWLLLALVALQVLFLWWFLRGMINMTHGFNEVLKGLQAISEELQRLRAAGEREAWLGARSQSAAEEVQRLREDRR